MKRAGRRAVAATVRPYGRKINRRRRGSGLSRNAAALSRAESLALYSSCTAVLTGADTDLLDEASRQLTRRGCRQLVQVLYGKGGSGEGQAAAWLAASSGSEAGMVRLHVPEAVGAAEARAAGAAGADLYNPDLVLYAEAESAAVDQPGIGALLKAAHRLSFPAAALPDDGRASLPFSRWDRGMILNAFIHWSLGGEKRTHVSMEESPYVLNREAQKLLSGYGMADPAEALAQLLAAGGAVIPVRTPGARTGGAASSEGLRHALAIRKAVGHSDRGRHRYPDLERRRAAAQAELPDQGI